MKYRITKVYRVWEEAVVHADDEEQAIEIANNGDLFEAVDRDLIDMRVEQE
jgi:hypothetical protein